MDSDLKDECSWVARELHATAKALEDGKHLNSKELRHCMKRLHILRQIVKNIRRIENARKKG